MKKSRQVINSPVISIADGREVGTVTDLVVNPDRRTVDFMLIKSGEQKDEAVATALPFKEALGVGEYAVTIQDKSAFVDLNKLTIVKDLLEKSVKVIGTKVLTKRGRLLGTVTEYMIDPDTGSIPLVVFVSQDGSPEQAIPLESVLSFGLEVLVVVEDIENNLQHFSEEAATGQSEPVQASFVPDLFDKPVVEALAAETITAVEVAAGTADQPVTELPDFNSKDSVENFMNRQKEFVLGKKLRRAISDSQGKVIAPEGTIISEEVFEQVKKVSRQKVLELTMLAE